MAYFQYVGEIDKLLIRLLRCARQKRTIRADIVSEPAKMNG